MTDELILTFSNIHDAIMGERRLLDAGIAVRVMPMPRPLGPVCGMALRIDAPAREQAQSLLGAAIRGLYRRASEADTFIPWEPER